MDNYISRRSFVGAAALTVIAGCGTLLRPGVAHAGSAYGSQTSLSAGGKTYYGKCMVGNGDGSAVTGWAITSASSVVSSGWLGAYVATFDSGGVRQTSKESYCSTSTQYFNVSTNKLYTPVGGYFYAQGRLYGWNGKDYTSKVITRTPNVGRSIPKFAIEEYPVNEMGLTYGSLLSAAYVGKEPDLVSAVTEEGEKGFVRLGDIRTEPPRSPDEASVLYCEETSEAIPVFDLCGNQIGEHILDYGGGSYEPFGMI